MHVYIIYSYQLCQTILVSLGLHLAISSTEKATWLYVAICIWLKFGKNIATLMGQAYLSIVAL